MFEKLDKIFREYFNKTSDEIGDETALFDIPDWDSMAHMTVIMRLEEEYEFMLSGDEIADLKKVEDIKKIIQEKAH